MKVLVVFALTATVAYADLVEDAQPPDTPTGLTVQLGKSSSATFSFKDGKTERVLLLARGKRFDADLRRCDLADAIHLVGMELRHDDQGKVDRGIAYLLFDVGKPVDVRFGKLPRVQLTWLHGELHDALITRATGPNSAFGDLLCGQPAQPNKSLERSRER